MKARDTRSGLSGDSSMGLQPARMRGSGKGRRTASLWSAIASAHDTLRAFGKMPAFDAAAAAARQLVYGSVALLAICSAALPAFAGAAAGPNDAASGSRPPAVAFYYGAKVPVPELSAFDTVVVEPDSGFDPRTAAAPDTVWMAYVSVGEVHPGRSYFQQLPKEWVVGTNSAWGSALIDQSAPGWPAFFVDHVIAPLWERGYRGFFLDTLDSYQLIAKTDPDRARQQAGIVALVLEIRSRYPEARLIFNRGFELLPQLYSQVHAVAFESLYRGWNQEAKRYTEVTDADREWLMAQINTAKSYGLNVIAIDYCPPADRQCARDTAEKIRSHGVVPYVTGPALDTVGVGALEVLPRRVLVVQDPPAQTDLSLSDGVRYLEMPLNYLGYRGEYLDVTEPLPQQPLNDRYAGIVLWLQNDHPRAAELADWLARQVDAGMRVAVFSRFGIPIDGRLSARLDLQPVRGTPQGPLRVETVERSVIGMEMPPRPDLRDYQPLRVGPSGRSLLRLKSGDFEIDAAAITPWGGYVMRPFAIFQLPEVAQARWVVQPLAFLKAALKLPPMPAPDVTTENGRRLLMAQIDGDGFSLRAESPASGRYAGEVLHGLLQRYGLPTTVSVIGSEVADDGPNRAQAASLRAVARSLFAMPNVEVASHTYTHPQRWTADGKDDRSSGKEADRRVSIEREVAGSVDFINRKLAPPGKAVKVLLWSGDGLVPGAAVKAAYEARVLNINGGETVITRQYPSWTAIAPLGVMKDGYYQVFSPNQSETRYTKYWQEGFYGYSRVLETFELTDQPIRFKPMSIYFNMFSGVKAESVKALEHVFDAVGRKPANPVFVSEYARKVLDFVGFSIARDGDFWVVRGQGQLRTIRLAPGEVPALAGSAGVAGYVPGPGGVYVHLAGSEARFRVIGAEAAAGANAGIAYLADANGRIERFRRSQAGMSFDLQSHVAPSFRLANAQGCQVRANGKPASAIAREPDSGTAQRRPQGALQRVLAYAPAYEDSRTAAGYSTHVEVDCTH